MTHVGFSSTSSSGLVITRGVYGEYICLYPIPGLECYTMTRGCTETPAGQNWGLPLD